MRSLFIAIIIFTLTFPPSLFAQELLEQPMVMDLKKGQKAPFDGIFLNSIAAAQMLAEKKYTLEECNIEIEFELEKQKAKFDLMLESANLSLEAANSRHGAIIKIKDDEIKRLQEVALERPNDY